MVLIGYFSGFKRDYMRTFSSNNIGNNKSCSPCQIHDIVCLTDKTSGRFFNLENSNDCRKYEELMTEVFLTIIYFNRK